MLTVKSCRIFSKLHSLCNNIFLCGLVALPKLSTQVIYFHPPSSAKILAVVCCLVLPWKIVLMQ